MAECLETHVETNTQKVKKCDIPKAVQAKASSSSSTDRSNSNIRSGGSEHDDGSSCIDDIEEFGGDDVEGRFWWFVLECLRGESSKLSYCRDYALGGIALLLPDVLACLISCGHKIH